MFSVEERDALRQRLIEHARDDHQVTACALIGSAARNEEDAWSDIDIALQISERAEVQDVASEWTDWFKNLADVADTLDIHASGALYRVFLLSNSLQIDVSFWPREKFRATGEPLHLIFGTANPPDTPPTHDRIGLIRMGWLYALHARSAIARGRAWQAEMRLADLRNQIIALACLSHGLNPVNGREAHRLPETVSADLFASRASSLDPDEQQRSFRASVELLRNEIAHHDRDIAASLAKALKALLVGRTE